MTAPNIEVTLASVLLPTPDVPFKEITTPNDSDTTTLDGTLYTDFINYRRSWSLQWGVLSRAQYDQIRAIYNAQFANEAYPLLEIPFYGVLSPAKMNISEKDIHFDGDCVYGFQITLLEQYAIS